MAELVRASVPRARASRELRERLFTAVARERTGRTAHRRSPRGLRRTVVAGMLFLAGVSLGLFGLWLSEHDSSTSTTSPAAAFVDDYLRRVVEQETLVSANREEIASFFARELGVHVEPPRLPDFRVERALICLLNGRRGAVVEYGAGGRQLSYYLIPVPTESSSGRARGAVDIRQVADDPRSPARLSNEKGVAVATWRDDVHQHALVGNLSADRLGQLARLVVDAPRGL